MQETETPIVSVITPTFNRASELELLINSIQNQTFDHSKYEMIIADDGSTDETDKLLKNMENVVDFKLKFVTQENMGPGAARNLGIQNSQGELILFIDSDCEADPKWMEIIYNEYVEGGFDACGGPDSAKSDFSPIQKAIDFSMTSFFTTGGMRGHGKNRLAKFYPRSHNMGMTKTLVKEVGGFGHLRHGQDIELSHRIFQSGANVKFISEAVVYHRRRTSIKLIFRQTFNWGVARINLYKIDKSLLEPIHFLPSLGLITIFGVIFGAGLSISGFQYLLLIGLILFALLCISGSFKHKDIRVLSNLILVIPTQIIGYGSGFLIAFTKRIIFGSELFTGFEKKYYSK